MRPNPLAAIPLVASLVFALGGCDRTAPSPDPKPSATTPADEKVSIIRDDVGIDREPTAPMAPLAITIGFPDGGARLSDAAVTALTDALGSEQMKAGGPITLGGHTDFGRARHRQPARGDETRRRGARLARHARRRRRPDRGHRLRRAKPRRSQCRTRRHARRGRTRQEPPGRNENRGPGRHAAGRGAKRQRNVGR